MRVILLGVLTQEQIRGLMSMTDVFAMPGSAARGRSRASGWHISRQGLRAFRARHGSRRRAEAVMHDRTGVVIPADHQEALDASLAQLVAHREYRLRLGHGARAHAAASPWSRVAHATYGDAVGGRPRVDQ